MVDESDRTLLLSYQKPSSKSRGLPTYMSLPLGLSYDALFSIGSGLMLCPASVCSYSSSAGASSYPNVIPEILILRSRCQSRTSESKLIEIMHHIQTAQLTARGPVKRD